MPLHPEAQAALDARVAAGARPIIELTPDEARQQSLRLTVLAGPGKKVARVQDRAIPGPLGEIPVRIYIPRIDASLPVLVMFHGGGWVTGSLETFDVTCREYANAADCIVVSVNYHHAPEHKYPAAAEDAYAATLWVAQKAASFNGDPSRVAVGGASAGGNLAAVVSQMARDRGAPPLAMQLLIVPVIDYNFDTQSYRDNAEGFGLTRAAMQWYWHHYLANEQDGVQPYASPIRAGDLRNLPPAFVITAEFDPLRDEGRAYAARLREAGVPVREKCYDGMIHIYLGTEPTADAAAELRAAFGT